MAEIVLRVVGAVGLLAIAVVVPNALQVLKQFDNSKRKYDPKYYFNKKVQSMIKNGLLEIKKENNQIYVAVTKKGRVQLEKCLFKEKTKIKQKWDGKWRVFTFDVWEKSRRKRDLLRKEIKDFGFIQLQQSVWIYPYECAEFIELLRSDLNFGKNVRYMVVESLDNDQALKKHFGLTT